MTRRTALALALVCAALAGVLVAARRVVRRDRAEQVERFAAERHQQVADAARQIGLDLDDTEAALRFAGRLLATTNSAADLTLQLRALLDADKQYREVRLYEPNGALMLSAGEGLSNAAPAEVALGDRAMVDTARRALHGTGEVESSAALTVTGGGWTRACAVTFGRDPAGPPDGAVVVLMELRRLFDHLHDVASSGDVRVILLGGAGEPTAASDPALAKVLGEVENAPASNPEMARLVAAMRRGEAGTLLLDEGRPGHDGTVAAFTRVRGLGGGAWSIATLSSTEPLREHEQALLVRLGLVAGATALILLAFAAFMVRSSRREAVLRERLRHADELSHLHEKTEKVLDNVPSGVIVLADDGRITSLNRVLRERCPEEAIGQPLERAFPEAPPAVMARLSSLVAAARASDRVKSLRGERLALFGGEGVYSLHAVPLERRFPEARLLLVVEDVSEIRSLASQLLRAEKLATIGVLSAGIAHEIGTPLGIVRGRAEYLQGKLGAGHPQASGLQVIVDQIDRVSRTIRQLLDFARVKPAHVALHPVEAGPVARAVIELLRFEAERRQVSLTMEERPALVAADPDQLQQVLLNLTMNALDACNTGGHVRLVVRPPVDEPGVPGHFARTRIEVIDDGCGIPEAQRLQVFDPFFTTKKRGQGTGLGLTMSAEIVRDHGAEIELESEPGKGTRVILLWPASATADPLIDGESAADKGGQDDGEARHAG